MAALGERFTRENPAMFVFDSEVFDWEREKIQVVAKKNDPSGYPTRARRAPSMGSRARRALGNRLCTGVRALLAPNLGRLLAIYI